MQNEIEENVNIKELITSAKRIFELALLSGCINYDTAINLTPKELEFFANLYIEKHNKEIYIQYLGAYFQRVKKLPEINKFYLKKVGELEDKEETTPDDMQDIFDKANKGRKQWL